MIDVITLGMAFREISNVAHTKSIHQISKVHVVQGREQFDISLTNQFVYQNRADWLVSAATNGFVDVDKPIQTGTRRYIPLSEAVAISQRALGIKKNNGMKLY